MVKPFIYDPSPEVRQTAAKTSQGIDDALNQYVQNKQQDYNFIVRQVENIEEVKQDATRFNRDVIYQTANDLEKQVIGLLGQDKKINLDRVGVVSNAIDSLKYATQQGKEVPQVLENYSKVIKDNAKFIPNSAEVYNKIAALAFDPQFMFSPQSITKAAENVINDSIDPQMYINEVLEQTLNIKDAKPVSVPFVDPTTGAITQVSYIPNPYYKLNQSTMELEPVMVQRPDGTMVKKIEADLDSIVPENIKKIIEKKSGGANAMPGFSVNNMASSMLERSLVNMSAFKTEIKTSAEQALAIRLGNQQKELSMELAKIKAQNDALRLQNQTASTQSQIRVNELRAKQLQYELDNPGSTSKATATKSSGFSQSTPGRGDLEVNVSGRTYTSIEPLSDGGAILYDKEGKFPKTLSKPEYISLKNNKLDERGRLYMNEVEEQVGGGSARPATQSSGSSANNPPAKKKIIKNQVWATPE